MYNLSGPSWVNFERFGRHIEVQGGVLMALALALWAAMCGLLAGGKLATDGKLKVRAAKQEALKPLAYRPCVGPANANCDSQSR